jgi:iron(III) transport system permease protein
MITLENRPGAMPFPAHRLARTTALFAFVAALAYLVLMPLIRLQVLAFRDGGRGYRVAFGTEYVFDTIRNTAALAAGSLVIGLFFGTLLAWWASRLPPRLRFLRALPILPIVVPAVANISGWAFLLSPRPGYLNALLRMLPWWSHLEAGPVDVYSLTWIVIITGFSLTAFVYLFVSEGLRNIGADLIEASRVHGSSALGGFFRVTLPLLRPVLLYGGGVALLLGLGQFTCPLLLGTNKGVSVLTTDMYAAVAQTPTDYAVAAAIGSPLLLFGVALVIFQKFMLGNHSRFVTHGGRAFRVAGKPSKFAAVAIVSFSLITTILPIASLVVLSLSRYWSPRIRPSQFTLDNFRAILQESAITNAILTSVTVSLVAVAISLVIGFVSACLLLRGRRHRLVRSALDIIVALPLGIPAVIFGAGFLFAYTQPPLVLYGTPWVLVVVYVTLMLPFTTRMQLSGMLQLGTSYLEASRVSGANAINTDLRVTLPLMRSTIGGAAALMFVLLTHEFTASVLVRSPDNQVMGTILFDYWSNGSYPLVAAIALIMTLVTAIGVLAAALFGGNDALSRL